MTSDPRPGDPAFPAAGPDDATSPWAAPVAPHPAAEPFGRANEPLGGPPPTRPVEAPRVRSKGSGGMLVNVLLGIALVVAVGGVAFAVGRATAPAATTTARNGFTPGAGGFGPNASGAPGAFNGGFGGALGGLSIQGTVTAVSADSITLQLASGQTVTIPTTAQTTYHERTAATAAAVTSGSTAIVQLEGAGRGAFNNGNGNGGQGGGPNASGAPGRTFGPATTVTVVPSGS